MVILSKMSEGEGNAKPPPKQRQQTIYWKCNYHIKEKETFTEIFEQLEQAIVPLCVTYSFGEEYGSSGETPHVEGWFQLKNKKEFSSIQNKLFKFSDLRPSKKAWQEAALKYSVKEGNQVLTNIILKTPIKVYKESELYPYQRQVVDFVNTDPDDRSILWIWGQYNLGKTQLAKFLIFNKLAYGPLEGGKRHILSVVANAQEEKAFILYLTASESHNQTPEIFSCLEKIKDGLFMSHFGTEGTKPVLMNSPHLLVFANAPPDFYCTEMDAERFHIWKINQDFTIDKGPPL